MPPVLLYYESLDSTNDEARRLLSAGRIQETTLIRARQQTAGKGTQGRKWTSPPDSGLYLSIVHPLSAMQRTLPITPLFTLAAGIACANALKEHINLDIHLKPINDLYVGQAKLGGILTESIVSQGQCQALITGIGLNILANPAIEAECLSDGRGNQPTSLQACVSPLVFNQWHLDSVMQELSLALAEHLDKLYQVLITGNTTAILEQYLSLKLPGLALPSELAALARNTALEIPSEPLTESPA